MDHVSYICHYNPQATWERNLTDPITTAIATAVAGSAATALTAEATRILKDITARIRHKLRGDPDAPGIPADTNGTPEEISALADRLHRAFHDEPDFETEITALWEDYCRAVGNTYTNNFYGTAHTSVIVGEHHGDLNING